MKRPTSFLLVLIAALILYAQDQAEGPTNEKAKKTYKQAEEDLRRNMISSAADGFRKADKQDDGHCIACQKKMIFYGMQLGDWKMAQSAAEEMIAQAKGSKDIALAHYELGSIFFLQANQKHKQELFAQAHEEMNRALAAASNFPDAIYMDGRILAYLNQDEQAKERFSQFAKMRPDSDPNRQRALRYVEQPELARARMAPAFAVTTLEGKRISLDDLRGKVVLLDFWATWCGPCRESLPHIRKIADKFQGEPFTVLSISLDDDEGKWKEFVGKNEMTWNQYYDGGFKGPVAQLFGVQAIPNTFTIDADGVLQDQHIGDTSIEGKLKKLIKRAHELQDAPKSAPADSPKMAN